MKRWLQKLEVHFCSHFGRAPQGAGGRVGVDENLEGGKEGCGKESHMTNII